MAVPAAVTLDIIQAQPDRHHLLVKETMAALELLTVVAVVVVPGEQEATEPLLTAVMVV
jgi:hypothetical protein